MIDLFNFDLDGTLIDTSRAIRRCQIEGLEEATGKRGSYPRYMIDTKGLEKTLEELGIDHDEFFKFHYKTFNPYKSAASGEINLINGVKEELGLMGKYGDMLALVNNSSKEATLEKLFTFNLESYFKHILAEYEKDKAKPNPYLARKLAESIGKDITSIDKIYNIGDSIKDMQFGDALREEFKNAGGKDYEVRNFLIGGKPSYSSNYIAVDSFTDMRRYYEKFKDNP